ncbi:MAG: hypothetical protein ACXIVQ_04700 [Acidimicrobiales bacterium]
MDPTHDQRRGRLRRRAMTLGPLLVVVGVIVLALGVPWVFVAGAFGLFVLWLLIEG